MTSSRRPPLFLLSLILLLGMSVALAQTGGGGGTGGGGTTGGGTVSRPSVPTTPQRPQEARPMFLSGKVVMDDGTPAPHGIVIERVCSGRAHREAYTDSHGGFSFQLGRNFEMMQDASIGISSDTMQGRPGMTADTYSSQFGTFDNGLTSTGEYNLMGCELRAVLAGYRSSTV